MFSASDLDMSLFLRNANTIIRNEFTKMDLDGDSSAPILSEKKKNDKNLFQ